MPRRLDIYDEDFSHPQAEERVFGKVQADPQMYAEHTSLQYALKKYLLGGKRVGMGMGIAHRALIEEAGGSTE